MEGGQASERDLLLLGSITSSNSGGNAGLAGLEGAALGAEALLDKAVGEGLALADVDGALADALVHSEPLVGEVISSDAGLDVAGELLLVGTIVLLLQETHVVGDVAAEDVGLEELRVGLALLLGTDEATGAVGHVQTTIGGTLDGGEETGTSGGAAETNIEQGLEGTAEGAVLTEAGGVELIAEIGVGGPELMEAELGEVTAGEQQADGVGSGVVGGADGHAVAGELVAVGGADDAIALDGREGELGNNIAVGEADHQAVLGAVVLVLVLDDQTLAGVVVGLSDRKSVV